jgi:hypothetical protein
VYNPRFLTEDGDLIAVDVDPDTIATFEKDVNPEYDTALRDGYGSVAPYAPVADDGPATPDPVVSRFQAKAALLQMGLLDQVENLMVGMDPMTRLAWTEAVEFRRSSPLLNSLAPYLTWPYGEALAEADLDDLFNLAQTIEV